ncbi:hypothetical protein REPUB_Repub04eG0260700 [Reevesia pubescens]
MESQVPYPSPQPQSHAYYSYSPQPQLHPHQAIINNTQPQNNVNVVQVPPYRISSPMPLPQNQQIGNAATGMPMSLPQNRQIGNAAIGMPMQCLPMPSPQMKVSGTWTTGLFDCMEDPTNDEILQTFFLVINFF